MWSNRSDIWSRAQSWPSHLSFERKQKERGGVQEQSKLELLEAEDKGVYKGNSHGVLATALKNK